MAIKDLFSGIKSGVKRASDKLDNAVDLQKVKYRISKIEGEMDDICLELGKNILTAVLDEKDFTDTVIKARDAYLAKKEDLLKLEEERRAREGMLLCANCQNEVDEDADFCPKCGAKITKPVTEECKEQKTAPEADTSDNEVTQAEESTNDPDHIFS